MTNITTLDVNTDPQDSDVIYGVDDPAGTPNDEQFSILTLRTLHDKLGLLERASDPSAPAEGHCIIWLSDGTGLGDDGDVLIAGTAGAATKYATLFDHSAGTSWP